LEGFGFGIRISSHSLLFVLFTSKPSQQVIPKHSHMNHSQASIALPNNQLISSLSPREKVKHFLILPYSAPL